MEQSVSLWRTCRPALWPAAVYSIGLSVWSFFSPNLTEVNLGVVLDSLVWEVPVFALAAWAGWLMAARGDKFIRAGLAGVLVFLVEHLIVHGATFILEAIIANVPDLLMALGGVVLSFLLFAPVYFIVGLCGAALARFVAGVRARAA